MYASTAKQPGTVIEISDTGIIIEYDDKSKVGYTLGRCFGNAAGLVLPHSIVTNLKIGQKVKVDDVICYNDGFFENDYLNPGQVVLKMGATVKTALMESQSTLLDGSAISANTAKLLETKTTKVKNVIVNFDQVIHKLAKVGSDLESEDILCIIEDAVSARTDLFDEESIDTLRVLSSQTPQAKVKGKLERIEFYYHGDLEDMSESLRTIANTFDKDLAKRNKSAGKPAFTGRVDGSYSIDGKSLALDTCNIKFYITAVETAGLGD